MFGCGFTLVAVMVLIGGGSDLFGMLVTQGLWAGPNDIIPLGLLLALPVTLGIKDANEQARYRRLTR